MLQRHPSPFLLLLLAGSVAGLALITHSPLTQLRASDTAHGPQAAPLVLEVVEHLGGPSNAVAVAGNHVLLAEGERVLVLDVHDPSLPRLVGRSERLRDFVTRILLDGRLAIVSTASAGVYVLDVGDPTQPVHVAHWPFDSVLALAGGRAYAADADGLSIVDYVNLEAPRVLGRFNVPGPVLDTVAVAAGVAWLRADYKEFVAVDVTDPGHLRELARVPTDDYISQLLARDGKLYVVGWQGVVLYDIRDPMFPRQLGSYYSGNELAAYAPDAVLDEDALYVARQEQGIMAYDVSRDTPSLVLHKYDGRDAQAVARGGGLTYVGYGRSLGLNGRDAPPPGLVIYENYYATGRYDVVGGISGVAVADGFTFLAAGGRGVQVVDARTPDGAQVVATLLPPDGAQVVATLMPPDGAASLVVGDGSLIVTGTNRKLTFYDVATPEAPRLAITVPRYSAGGRVVLRAGHAYFTYQGGLWVMDVRTPSAPRAMATLSFPWPAYEVALAGDHLVVATDGASLTILDLVDPAAPQPRGMLQTGSWVDGLAAGKNLAFYGIQVSGCTLVTPAPVVTCAPGPSCTPTFVFQPAPRRTPTVVAQAAPQRTCPPDVGAVQVMDVGTPDAPRLRGQARLMSPVERLWAGDDLVLVDGRQLDVSNPDGPVLSDPQFLVADPSYRPRLLDAAPAADLLHVAAGPDGYFIFRRLPAGAQTATATATQRWQTAVPSATSLATSTEPPSPPDRVYLPLAVVRVALRGED